jgi:beta-galactosidase
MVEINRRQALAATAGAAVLVNAGAASAQGAPAGDLSPRERLAGLRLEVQAGPRPGSGQ